MGKGNKERRLTIPHPLASILTRYLEEVRPSLPDSDMLLANPNGLRTAGQYGATTQWVIRCITADYGDEAGVPGQNNPHRWRHTYATELLREGTNLYVISRLLGHSDIKTTIKYLHLDDDILRQAVDQVFPSEDD